MLLLRQLEVARGPCRIGGRRPLAGSTLALASACSGHASPSQAARDYQRAQLSLLVLAYFALRPPLEPWCVLLS